MFVSTWNCRVLAVDPPHGLHAMLLAQPIGHVDQREAGGDHALRLDFDDDLADVAPLDRHVGNVGNAADAGPQVVIGVVAQRRRIAPAGDGEGDDGKDRRRLPLDDRARAGGKLRATSAIFARTSFRAWIMSLPGTKSMRTSAAPRTERVCTRCTPRTTLTASSIGRVTPTSTSLTASPGVCTMITIRGNATSG